MAGRDGFSAIMRPKMVSVEYRCLSLSKYLSVSESRDPFAALTNGIHKI